MAALTGILAQLRAPHPWLPQVPISGQVLAVLLAGVLLGGTWGGLSQAIYFVLGAAGMPWFSGWGAGIAYLSGPSGGFLIGFVPAAFLIGYVSERCPGARRFWPQVGLMLAGVAILYLTGALQCAVVLRAGFMQTFAHITVCFLPIDLAKALVAAGLAALLLPKEPYGPESTR
jgi:biotin transport system substrate-specific component